MIAEFATLIGLLCNYRQEKGGREALDHQKFIEWLQYHRHEELKTLIVNTAALRTEIDNLLREDQAKMIQKLNQISDILMKLLGQVEQFKSLAVAVAPNAQLSDQAIFILRQFVESGDDQFYYSNYGQGQWSMQLSRSQEGISVIEPRFIEDDLNQLVSLGLITGELTGNDSATYSITRSAVRFIAAIDENAASTKLKDNPPTE